MTLAEALRAASQQFETAGIEGATRDARWLLAHVLKIDPGVLTGRLNEVLTREQMTAFEATIAARVARQPVSQITGKREFWGREFLVTQDVLDPRPDTETLISVALSGEFNTLLDLGTGSGAILVTLLAERPTAQGQGTDLSQAALGIAQKNAERLGVSARAVFQTADWFAGIEGQFDLIVSNPPYIALEEMPGLAPEVRLWEPELALTDQADGLNAYRAIAKTALSYLLPGGRLIVEIGATQRDQVQRLFQQAGFVDIAIHVDLNGLDRVVSARKP